MMVSILKLPKRKGFKNFFFVLLLIESLKTEGLDD